MSGRVLLLATKNTMAYSRRPGHEAVASGAELLRTIPARDVTVEDVLAEPSWDISPATMLALARRTRTAIIDDGFAGVVVTHGIDTLEETAFLTDALAPGGAVVFTGATRYLDDLGSDGPRNLAAALTAAADPALRDAGVVVCFDDELHAARHVTLVDTAGFSSAPFPPLGRVVGGRVELLSTPPPRPPEPAGEPEADVALIKTYPGIEPVLLTAAVDAGARGVVLEGTGSYNVPVNLFTTISDLTAWDIPVVIASRSRARAVDLAELDPPDALAATVGAIGARGLAPAKARAALMVALGGKGGVEAARSWFAHL